MTPLAPDTSATGALPKDGAGAITSRTDARTTQTWQSESSSAGSGGNSCPEPGMASLVAA